jgi:hypothetical protein
VLVGIGVALVCWLRPALHTGPTSEAYRQVQAGMTEVEVERVLGMPPGDYSTAPTEFLHIYTGGSGIIKRKATSILTWTGNDLEVDVYFDQNGLVIGKNSWGNLPRTPWWERARRWLEQLF